MSTNKKSFRLKSLSRKEKKQHDSHLVLDPNEFGVLLSDENSNHSNLATECNENSIRNINAATPQQSTKTSSSNTKSLEAIRERGWNFVRSITKSIQRRKRKSLQTKQRLDSSSTRDSDEFLIDRIGVDENNSIDGHPMQSIEEPISPKKSHVLSPRKIFGRREELEVGLV